jgi:hypothetical protein
MFNHPQPRRSVVMSTIDAHAIHALLKQGVNKWVIVCRLVRHGDHDPDSALGSGGAQQTFCVFGKQLLAMGEIDNWRILRESL